MKVESIIKREPHSVIDMGDTTYKFVPDDQGRHVAEVDDTDHLARLLSISEGYRLVDDAKVPKRVQAKLDEENEQRHQQQQTLTPVSDEVLTGSTVHPATVDLGDGEQTSIDDVVFEAHVTSGLTTREWNELPADARHDLIDAQLDLMSGEKEDDKEALALAAAEEARVKQEQIDKDAIAKGGSTEGKGTDAPKEGPTEDDPAEREALAQEYKTRFGKLPHGKWNVAKIKEELKKDAK